MRHLLSLHMFIQAFSEAPVPNFPNKPRAPPAFVLLGEYHAARVVILGVDPTHPRAELSSPRTQDAAIIASNASACGGELYFDGMRMYCSLGIPLAKDISREASAMVFTAHRSAASPGPPASALP